MSEEVLREKLKKEQEELEQSLKEDGLPEYQRQVVLRLLEASYEEEPIKARIVREVAGRWEENLPAILHVIQNPYKECWDLASLVLREIGYPHNAPAIPQLIRLAADVNNPSQITAIQTLQMISPSLLSPYLIRSLWDRGQQNRYWGVEVSHICALVYEPGQDYAVLCGPVIAYLLGREFEVNKILMLYPFEIVPAEEAGYVLPVLIDLFSRRETTPLLHERVRQLLLSFPREMLQPYEQILPLAARTLPQ